jgi:precorrin-2 dehydrogenase/sirohydrochlorin ferrochelatase
MRNIGAEGKSMKQEIKYYPLFLDLRGRKCLVIGGGRVALRKVMTLLEYGASITVISPELCPELAGLAEKGRIHAYLRPYQAGDLQEAFLAFAATDNSDINKQIAEEARHWKVPVNIADSIKDSDFIIPSSVRRGNITVAVATDGISPALARKIRSRLEKIIGDEYVALVNLVGEVRSVIKKSDTRPGGEDWQEALDLDLILEMLKKGDKRSAKNILLDNLKSRSK